MQKLSNMSTLAPERHDESGDPKNLRPKRWGDESSAPKGAASRGGAFMVQEARPCQGSKSSCACAEEAATNVPVKAQLDQKEQTVHTLKRKKPS